MYIYIYINVCIYCNTTRNYSRPRYWALLQPTPHPNQPSKLIIADASISKLVKFLKSQLCSDFIHSKSMSKLTFKNLDLHAQHSPCSHSRLYALLRHYSSWVTWVSHVWHDSVKCETSHSCLGQPSHMWPVTWFFHMWHDSVTCDMIQSHLTWLVSHRAMSHVTCYDSFTHGGRVPGLPNRDCAGSCNSSVQTCTTMSAIHVTAKTYFERLCLVPGMRSFAPWVHCPCALTPPLFTLQLFLDFGSKNFPEWRGNKSHVIWLVQSHETWLVQSQVT